MTGQRQLDMNLARAFMAESENVTLVLELLLIAQDEMSRDRSSPDDAAPADKL